VNSHVCFVSYHELGLKGKNRSVFERRLADNISFALGKSFPVRRIQGRILVEVDSEERNDEVALRIAQIPGVANVMPSYVAGRDLDEMCHVALRAIKRLEIEPHTFRVTARRSNTDFEMTSMELNVAVGSFIAVKTGMTVNLTKPEVNVRITVVGGHSYISVAKIEGAGGLPVGSSGKLISLLSTGIDSPVATWKMMRRGAICIGLHFSAAPTVTDTSGRLVREIGDVLARTGGLSRIYTVAFGDVQREIASVVYPDLRILMYRRVMIAVASKIAQIEKAKVLVTGESLGQVASQTLDNIVATGHGCDIPIFRPLIGDDKHEIVALSQRIGTFELSSQPVDDCCTLFMPRQPETHVKIERIYEADALLDYDAMIAQCLETIEWHDYPCNQYKPPKDESIR
jgi:thiamine biosynthesis protein ThiI